MKYQEGILKRVRALEHKNAIFYAKPGEKLYKTLRVLYIIVFAYCFIFSGLAPIISMFNNPKYFEDQATDKMTVAICFGLVVIAFVLMLMKFHKISAVLTTVPSVIMIFAYKNLSIDQWTDAIKINYYWRFLIPLGLLALLAFWIGVLVVRADMKTKYLYIKVTENLYNLYKVNVESGKEISESEWEEFLERYDPFNYKPQFLDKPKDEEESEE